MSLAVVRRRLRAYADRGVFRGLTEHRPARGRYRFSFTWLAPRPFDLSFDPRRGVLAFEKLLHDVPARSTLYQELKRFVAERSDGRLPAHRRIDPRRASLRATNRRGIVSISLRVKSGHYVYGVTRLVHVVHELFLLLKTSYAEYVWEEFEGAQE